MKLAIVTTHPIQYNAPWFKLLAQEKGIDVKVFYTWDTSATIAKYDPGFGKVIEWDIPLLEGYEYSFVKNIAENKGSHHFKGIDNPTLNKEIEDWKAEAILVLGWAYKSHLACLRHFKHKIPVLFRGDSTLLDETQGIKKILRRLFLRYIYSHIDYALYVGENNKSYFLAHGLREKQLVFTPHAIDNERFSTDSGKYEEQAAKRKQDLNIGSNCFTVLFSGKLEPKKNPQFIIALSEKLTDEKYRFLIVGNGELESQLKAMASHDNRIIFLDFQNQQQMPVVYRMCDVFVLPSRGPNETWGLALNEAMACGKPVIASNKTGGAMDMIKDNGLIINPEDVESAAVYITRLASDSIYYKGQAEVSRERINTYSFPNIVNSITGLISNLAEQR